jgi:hypothetical protein
MERKLNGNTRCIYLNSPTMVTGLKLHLSSTGVDVNEEIEKGSLILSSDRRHLVKGRFDANLMLDMLEEAVDQAMRDGYFGLWATGDMTWELGQQESIIDLLQYEWRLEDIFRRRPTLSGICQYHLDTLPQNSVRQGLVAHPSIFVNETLSRINPHYVQPMFGGHQHPENCELDEFFNRLTQA